MLKAELLLLDASMVGFNDSCAALSAAGQLIELLLLLVERGFESFSDPLLLFGPERLLS